MILLAKVDDYLLKKFQEFSEHKQVTTDKHCYYFAYESYKFDLILSRAIPSLMVICFVLVTGGVFMLLIPAYFVLSWRMQRHFYFVVRYASRQTKKIPEPPAYVRYYTLLLCTFMVGVNLWLGYLFRGVPFVFMYFYSMALSQFAAVGTIYFLSCTPLPPETLEFRRNAKRSTKTTRSFKPQTA